MRNRIIFIVAILGVLGGLLSAYLLSQVKPALAPVYQPVSSPYETAIYANGMIESAQSAGENINIFPEVSGPVTQLLVHEGQAVKAGTLLLQIDDTIQRATTEQLQKLAEASYTQWQELKSQPRKEALEISKAQVDAANASLVAVRDQYEKRLASYELDHRSISKDVLDTAKDAVDQAQTALNVAQKQYDLTKAGAWSFDIATALKQFQAAHATYQAAAALWAKYAVKAPVDGVVLAINAGSGSYVSPIGAYDTYTQTNDPLIVMSVSQEYLSVRCFIDEILIAKLPDPSHIRAEMQIRGTDKKIALEFVRIQPIVSPKIELSNQRQEKVDLRVLPVIFRFPSRDLTGIFPGQQVDVYIGKK